MKCIKKIKEICNGIYDQFFPRCSFCKWRKAVWYYGPGPDNACDKCVPRGCSCNEEPKPEILEKYNGDYFAFGESEDGKKKESYFQPVDKEGRQFPCCEWFYFMKEQEKQKKKEAKQKKKEGN